MSTLPHDERFEGLGGLPLYLEVRRPALMPAAGSLIYVHGLGEHVGLDREVLDRFAEWGYRVWAPDLRGHGRSGGRRGHIDRWEEYQEDLRRLVARVAADAAGPLFLIGNSLGAAIVLDYAAANPRSITGVVAIAPPLGALGVPAWLMALGRVASRLWPTLTLNARFDLSRMSREPAVVATVLADPLFHREGTARLATEYLAAVARIHAGARSFPVPALLLHGTGDRMASIDGTREFARHLPPDRGKLIEYPGAYHVLLYDLDREQVMADMQAWCTDRSREREGARSDPSG